MSQGNKPNGEDEMRAEYDIRGGVRGKYYGRYQQGLSIVRLKPTEVLTREQLQSILNGGNFDDLIGTVENDWLECKAAPYQVKEEHQKQELAKDVSALANASGGVILIGVKTQRHPEHFGDEIQKLRPFPQDLIDPNQYHDILKSWIYPTPQLVEIKWHPSFSERTRGILSIVIPTQSSVHKPFLLTRTLNAEAKLVEIVFGYTERRRSNVDAMTVQQLHALMKDGLRFESLDQRLERLEEGLEVLRQEQHPRRHIHPQLDLSKSLPNRLASAVVDADLGGRRSFALAAIPVPAVEIPGLFERRDADLVRLLENPPELRPAGFDLKTGSSARIERGQYRRAATPKYKTLELWRDGTLIFAGTADEDFLCWGKHSSAAALKINPLALTESTYLFADLSRQVFGQTKPQPKAFQYFIELKNMTLENRPSVLFPGPVGTFGWVYGSDAHKPPGPSFTSQLRWDKPSIEPGRVAFRLVREIYRWFGIEDEEIPYVSQMNGEHEINPDQIRKAGS